MDDGLWTGAEVEWVGPRTSRRGTRIDVGDRAVVVDAGRHHIRSFGVLSAGSGWGPSRRRRGVLIRLAGGTEVEVARRQVRLVAPDHPLRPEPDASVAEWWLAQVDPWGAGAPPVRSLVPPSFPAVAQVLHPWSAPDGSSATWQEVASTLGFVSAAALDAARDGIAVPTAVASHWSEMSGALDQQTAEVLVEVLAGATSTPDDVLVAVWDGWGDVPVQRFPGAALLPTEHRGHFLLRGPLRGVLIPVGVSPMPAPVVSGIWWPADRAWHAVTEIDLAWTFVAGSEALVDRLVGDPRLEAVRIAHGAPANRVAGRT